MTDRRGLLLVAGRELRESLRRRTVWIVMALVLAASTAAVVVPEVLDEGPTSYDVAVVDGSADLSAQLEAVADSLDVELDLVRGGRPARGHPSWSRTTRSISRVVVGDEPVVVAKEGRAADFVAAAQQVVGIQALVARLGEAGVSPSEVQDALAGVAGEGRDTSRRRTPAAGGRPPSWRSCSTSC